MNLNTKPARPPTPEECSNHAVVNFTGRRFMAVWYPQIGGYVGRAWVSDAGSQYPDGKPGSCFDAWVYHDGEFPFAEDETRSPAHLHHCAPEQFVEFGNAVAAHLAKR